MNRLVWAATCTIRVGEYHIGVRSSTQAVHRTLTSAVEPHLVDDPNAPLSYAIHETSPGLKHARPVYRIYHDCNHVFTARTVERAVAVVAAHLEWYRSRPPQDSGRLLELDVVAFVDGESALLAPWFLPYKVPEVEIRARKIGRHLVEGRSVLVDPETTEVVVPPVTLLSGPSVEREQAKTGGPASALTPPGRWPIAAWLFLPHRGMDGEMSRGQAVARAMGVTYRHQPPATILTHLAGVMGRTEVYAVADIGQLVEVVSTTPSTALFERG